MRTNAGAGRLGVLGRVPATQGRKGTGGENGVGEIEVGKVHRPAT